MRCLPLASIDVLWLEGGECAQRLVEPGDGFEHVEDLILQLARQLKKCLDLAVALLLGVRIQVVEFPRYGSAVKSRICRLD